MNLLLAVLFAVLPPCQTEDSTNCSWDAQHQGNQQGHSFVNLFGTAFQTN